MGKPRVKKKKTKVVRRKDKEAREEARSDGGDEKKSSHAGDDYRSATGVLISKPTARDVKIGNFSLISHGTQLIHDTTIEFSIGRRYGLIGLNGSGKSTFMRCLAAREVPVPDHIDIYYLENEAEPEEVPAIDCVVRKVENRVAELEGLAEKYMEEYGPESELLHDVYTQLDDFDPSTFRSRAGELLHGLGFSPEMMKKNTCDMSGGWRMRVALAQALFAKPTLLLLDEPTNHLDLGAVVWLENYLAKYDRCLVVVSHSADFMNTVCTNIIHITMERVLKVYSGNYDTFVKTKREVETNQLKMHKKEQEDIKHLKAFIASCGTYSNLVKQAKSKQKIIDKMMEKGLTPMPIPDPVFNFQFPEVQELPPPMMSFEDVAFSYSGKPEDYLYSHLNLAVPPDARIALVGDNGTGKSTLLKLMCSDLDPCEGQVRRHLDLKFGRFHQHSAEALDVDKSALNYYITEFADLRKNDEDWRSHIGRFGLTGKMQTMPMGKLSDGQRSRMVFSLIAQERPNCLLLDEPTNHLDMESIDALARAINAWNGALILVSHDFRLIDQVAKELWVVEDKAINTWPNGDIRSYKEALARKQSKQRYKHVE